MKKGILILLVFFQFSLFAQDYEFGEINKEDFLVSDDYSEYENDAVYLFKNQNTTVVIGASGLRQTTRVHERILILSDQGLEYGTKQIPLYRFRSANETVDKMRAASYYIKSDGSIHKEEVKKKESFLNAINENWNEYSLNLPLVKKGSIVEFEYTIVSPSQQVDDLIIQEDIPIKNLNYSFSSSSTLVYKYHLNPLTALNPNITSSSTDGLTIQMNNVPALKSEPLSDGYNRFRAFLKVELSSVDYKNVSNTWDQISRAAFESERFGKQLRKKKFFKADLQEFLKTESLDINRLNEVYTFVKEKVKWNNDYGYFIKNGIQPAYNKGSGNVADINLLLISALEEAGFDTYPVLTATKSRGIPLYPTRYGFNYVIAAVNLNDQLILLDATRENLTTGQLPSNVRNWQGRLIKKDGSSEFIELYATSISQQFSLIDAVVNPNGMVSGNASQRNSDYFAFRYRNIIRSDDEKAEQDKLEQYLKEDGLDIKNIKIKNLNNFQKPIDFSYSFDYKQGVEIIGDYLFISPLLFESNDSNPFDLEERKLPLELGFPASYKVITNIQIPDGYKVKSVPESTKLVYQNDQGHYQLIVKPVGNRIQVTSEYVMKEFIIFPESYKTFRDYFKSIVVKDNEKIVLVKI